MPKNTEKYAPVSVLAGMILVSSPIGTQLITVEQFAEWKEYGLVTCLRRAFPGITGAEIDEIIAAEEKARQSVQN